MIDVTVIPSEKDRLARMVQCALRVGCVVEETTETVEINGERFTAFIVHAEDNLQAISLLNDMARDEAEHDPDIRFLARGFIRHTFGGTSGNLIRTPLSLARTLQNYVRANVAFVTEPGEAFRSAALTLKLGAGDCDDSAHLLVALAMACGMSAKVAPVFDEEGEISHVAARIYVDGTWQWAETTFEADFGEEPRAAAKRLGILREDLK